MTAILGISAFYHDSAAALVVDGKIVAAAQEERFTRMKHDHEFPVNAIDYCLEEAGLRSEQLDYVGFYDKPFLKFERILETYLSFAPVGFRSFLKAMPLWMRQKLHLPRQIDRGLDGGFGKRIVFTEHHESHAASAFFPSPFEEAAILTLDGVGEWTTASFGEGRGNRVNAHPRAPLSPLAGAAVLGLHLLLRLQGELGRVQADGAGALRRAPVRGRDPGQPDRSQGRRLVPDGPELLQLLPGSDHDLAEVRPAVRRPAPATGNPADPARDGPRRLDPEGDRGDHAAGGAARPRRHRHEEPLSGGWCGAELRRQRSHPQGGSVRSDLDSAGRRRRRRRPRCGPVHLVPAACKTRARSKPPTARADRCWVRGSPTEEIRSFLDADRCRVSPDRRRGRTHAPESWT